MNLAKCPTCNSNGCLDMVLAHKKQVPFQCPTKKQYIYFNLPEGMVSATAEDFFQNGTLRLNMPFLVYDTQFLYYAFFIDEYILRRELEGFEEMNCLYIKSEHKLLTN